MLEQHARVVHSSEHGVWVKASAPAGCGICAGQTCASQSIAELFQRVPRQYQVESGFPVLAGDEVIVAIPEGSVLRSALYLYGLPLIAMLLGAMLAHWARTGDAAAAVGAGLGLLTAGVWIATRSQSVTRARPIVIRHSMDESILEEE